MVTQQRLQKIIADAMEKFNSDMPSLPKKEWDAWWQQHEQENLSYWDCPVSEELKGFFPFTKENTVIAFCTEQNIAEVRFEFCTKYFPRKLEGRGAENKNFDDTGAEAFVGKEKNGILLRCDLDYSERDYFVIVLHELAHIYCTRTEVVGEENFIDIYWGTISEKLVEEDSVLSGCLAAGQEIWREFIADYIANSLAGIVVHSLADKKAFLKHILSVCKLMVKNGENSKGGISRFLFEVMTTEEALNALQNVESENAFTAWMDLRQKMEKLNIDRKPKRNGVNERLIPVEAFDSPYKLAELVFLHIVGCPDDRYLWNITQDFILELGEVFIEFRCAYTFR